MSSRTVFRKLEKVYALVLKEQSEIEKEIKNHQPVDKDRIELVRQKKDLLDDVVKYVNSYEWLKHFETIERLKFFLKNKYSYNEYCKQYDVSYESAKVSISYANQKLLDKIGSNTLDLITEGRIEEARATFYFRTGQLKLRNYVLDSALAEVPDADYMTININDCEKELLFLRYYSQALLEARSEDLDKDKLAYLRYIIEGDNPKLSEMRLKILDTISGKLKVKDFIEQVQEKTIY